jgi:hypothetical protein
MQNFKSFLLKEEENHNPKNHDLSLAINCDSKIYTPEIVEDYENTYDIELTEKEMCNELSELMPNKKIDCYFANTLIVSVDIDKSEKNITLEYQNKITKEVEDNLNKMLHSIMQTKVVTSSLLIREQLPEDIKIQANIADLYLPWAKPFSLSGFDKQLLSCRILNIKFPEKIIGGTLSLLKIKDLHTINCDISPEWLNIIKKHLTSKDILECQEELITNGFREYAKL